MIVGSTRWAGAAYYRQAHVLTYDGQNWVEQLGMDASSHVANMEYFHSNVAIEGDWVLFGSPQV